MRAASEPEALADALSAAGLAAGAGRPGGLLADGLAARRAARGRLAGDLHRDAPGQRGDEDHAEQDRSERRPRAGADHAHGLVPAGSCQEPPVPAVAVAAGGPPHGPERDAQHRERGAGDAARGRPQARTPRPGRFAGRVRELAGDDDAVMAMVEPLLAVLRTMREQLDAS